MSIPVLNADQKEASEYTLKSQKAVADDLNLSIENCYTRELDHASANCILRLKDLKIKNDETGETVWDVEEYQFYETDEVPSTINPSLWINGKGNSNAGVFEVLKDAIYQVRGIDIANLSAIRGKTGWILQDVGTTIETARTSIELLEKALNENIHDNIKAVIISHSHTDHYGGIRGVVKEEDVGPDEATQVQIYVPEGFDEECVKETIFAGSAMGRRADYQFGSSLKKGPKGFVSSGLGLAIGKGTVSFITPTNYIRENGPVVIDGITVDFQLTPGTEAPAEMNNYFVDYKAFWVAENCTGTLHNLYPIRGAQLRDSSGWAGFILEAMSKYADKSVVVFQSHNWPHYNTPEDPHGVRNYLLNNAAMYKYIHDQTLLYANQGFTAKEIARKLRVPEGLKLNFYARPYYGSLPINARAVYTKYLGFFNGNPNDVDPLTELEEAEAFVAYAGPADKILEKAYEDLQKGNYRRAAFAAGKVVLAEPRNQQARFLTADAFEQMGYASESSVWRNAYLQGALELRIGLPEKEGTIGNAAKSDLTRCMSSDLLLKYIGILYDNHHGADEEFELLLDVTENTYGVKSSTRYVLKVHAGVVLTYPIDEEASENSIEAYAKLTKLELFYLIGRQLDQVKDGIETNSYELLKRVEKHLTDVSKLGHFQMIESNEKR
ncbi:MAG: MBL fold metallo-hydrolase [Eubacterium sp.]|nr:MBL fold metallo-hydrolase [Eubacterium sp.]